MLEAANHDLVLDALRDRARDLGPKPAEGVQSPWKSWTLTRDKNDYAWAVLDRPGSSANTLSEDVLEELNALLDAIDENKPKALIIRSGKAGGFIAGADVTAFRGANDTAAIEAQMTRAHEITDRLEALTLPTIAVVHGYCLGGGLEIALACAHRVAVEGSTFGFPEVQLGLHPGLGGTVRLNRLIDPLEAMQMMLTGRTITAKKAKALGLVDAVVPERYVRAAVKAAVEGRIEEPRLTLRSRVLDTGTARRLLAQQMRTQAEKAAPHEHYPAPTALIELWEKHGGDPKAMKREEIVSFAKLMVTPTAQNLIRVFFLREKLKGLAGKAPDIRHVHVIGAGAMGGDIAAWCAWNGIRTTLGDVKPEPLAGAIKRAATLYAKIGHGDRLKVRDALDLLIPDLKGEGARHADLIIEAAPENLDLKHKIYAGIEPQMKEGAVLASNTSSIPLEKLREGLEDGPSGWWACTSSTRFRGCS